MILWYTKVTIDNGRYPWEREIRSYANGIPAAISRATHAALREYRSLYPRVHIESIRTCTFRLKEEKESSPDHATHPAAPQQHRSPANPTGHARPTH